MSGRGGTRASELQRCIASLVDQEVQRAMADEFGHKLLVVEGKVSDG